MKQNENTWFYMGGSGLDRTNDLKKFADQNWIGFNFFGSRLDSDCKFHSQLISAKLYWRAVGGLHQSAGWRALQKGRPRATKGDHGTGVWWLAAWALRVCALIGCAPFICTPYWPMF